jgi:acetyltransferase-like isoleucine patch superfamily enzyme
MSPRVWGDRSDDVLWFGRGARDAHKPIVGQRCVLGWGSVIDCTGQVTIGNDVFVGHRVMILTGLHDYMQFGAARMAACQSRPVTIGDGVWICSGAIVCPGVTLGAHSVVAAGAVVMRNVRPYTLVGGNPAQNIRRLQ